MPRDDDRDYDRDDRERDYDRDERDYDTEDVRVATKKVKPPAIGLLVAGILSLLSIGWGVYQYVNFDKEFDAAIEKSQRQQGGDPRQQEAEKQMAVVMKDVVKVVLPIGMGVQSLAALLMIFGSTRTLSLSGRGWGVTAGVAAVIPHLTCLIWCLTLAFGIWMLVTLSNKEVKRGYAAKARLGRAKDRDDYDRRDR